MLLGHSYPSNSACIASLHIRSDISADICERCSSCICYVERNLLHGDFALVFQSFEEKGSTRERRSVVLAGEAHNAVKCALNACLGGYTDKIK